MFFQTVFFWRSSEKKFLRPFFLRKHLHLSPWPWPRAFLFLASDFFVSLASSLVSSNPPLPDASPVEPTSDTVLFSHPPSSSPPSQPPPLLPVTSSRTLTNPTFEASDLYVNPFPLQSCTLQLLPLCSILDFR